jgi:hypothetical protein
MVKNAGGRDPGLGVMQYSDNSNEQGRREKSGTPKRAAENQNKPGTS